MSLNSVYITRPDVAKVGPDLLRNRCSVTMWDQNSPVPKEELLKQIAGKNALFCTLNDKIDTEVLDTAGPSLTVIGTMSVGFDHIDLNECKKRNIRVGYTPDVLTDATAELTIGLLLATSRRLIEANQEVHSGGWKSWSPSWMCGPGVKGSTVGIVGFGRIGQQVAKILKTFNPAKIIYHNRSVRPEAKEIGAVKVPFDELLAESDFIICLSAYTPETKGMFNSEVFSKMKQNSIFINTSRGALVDQKALVEALKNKTIRAAGLDVTTPEPLPLDSDLLKLKNCVVFPHIGSAEIKTRTEMSKITALNILAGLEGGKMIAEL